MRVNVFCLQSYSENSGQRDSVLNRGKKREKWECFYPLHGNKISKMYQRRQDQDNKSHQNDKLRVIAAVKRHLFDKNPLLTTPHQTRCKTCGKRVTLIYLDYLRSGRFKLGEAVAVEVPQAYASGFTYEKEQTTPILIEIQCPYCKSKIEVKPVSLEYLLFTMGKSRTDHMYG